MKIEKIRSRNNSRRSGFISLGVIIGVFTVALIAALFMGGYDMINSDMILRQVKDEVYDSIPIETETNITFLEHSRLYEDVTFSYESTNKDIITDTGKVTRRLNDVYVQINIIINLDNETDVVMKKSVKVLKYSSLDSMEIIENEIRNVIGNIINENEIIDKTELPRTINVDGNPISLSYEKYAKTYGIPGEENSENVNITSIEIETLEDVAIIHMKNHGERIRCRIVVNINYGGQIKPMSISVFTII